jgi:hypothetical protein
LGDPLRTVVEVPTELAVEEAAAQFGFGEPRARLVSSAESKLAQWIPQRGKAIGGNSRVQNHAAFVFEGSESPLKRWTPSKRAAENWQERRRRFTESCIIKRLASIEESVVELRHWSRDISQSQKQICHLGEPRLGQGTPYP